VEEVRVDERGEKVVRRGDGVKVAGEMQIDLLAGLDLREPAAGGAAFHAEDRAEGGLAEVMMARLPRCSSPGRGRWR